MTHPSAEVTVDVDLVRRLLLAQSPDFAHETLRFHDEGWDNFTFRLGERYAVRLPRRQLAVSLIGNEQRWLPDIASRLPIEIPVPVFAGRPSAEFVWPWSVVKWIPGDTAEALAFDRANASRLADVLIALHQSAPPEAPANPFRGVALATRTESFEERLRMAEAEHRLDVAHMRTLWNDLVSVPPSRERRWLHGDLHPRNLVVRERRFVGVIDWGDVTAGDVATDLAAAWMLIDSDDVRREFFARYGADADLQKRARGWALHLGVAFLISGEGRQTILGAETIRRLLHAT
ncbi:aminoglycoside phosphotransferase family protein [Rubinisphaera margarita]|uniref:aminoglycoside phosphotransferase family protein n=1 Tax=Rubinisphaera margarita TaxID=2909586 RepID=UPI001EE81560|nr:aminoglycoside phosphotransferase family protein [Rubinisphaera margarita]MCG6154818.1 aminoglycoside phosphotransferase family protein [Rubinisphaera margarita]